MGETPWDRSGRRDPPQAAFPRARRGHRGGRRARRGRPGGRRARRPTRGHPPRPVRGRRLSKSATKAPIEPERTRRNVDIPRFCSPPIPPRGAFVADLDTPPPRTATGTPPAPPRRRSAATNPGEGATTAHGHATVALDATNPGEGAATARQRSFAIVRTGYRRPEPENTGRPGPDVVQLARGLRCRCRCRRQSASGSGGWSCRRRGRRKRPGAPPSAGRIRQRAPG